MTDTKVGDKLRVIDRSPYRNQPDGGWPATVVKVGRKYATAIYETTHTDWRGQETRNERTVEFDMATGREKGSTTNYGLRVETPEQVEQVARKSAAESVLHARKIRLDFGHGLTLEQIEALAEVVKTFGAVSADA